MNTTEVILTNQSKDPKPLANQDDSIPYRIDGTKGIYIYLLQVIYHYKKNNRIHVGPNFSKSFKKTHGIPLQFTGSLFLNL